jgi:hypothetical protein
MFLNRKPKPPRTFYYHIKNQETRLNKIDFKVNSDVYSGVSLIHLSDRTYLNDYKDHTMTVVGYRFKAMPPEFNTAYYQESITLKTPHGMCTAVAMYSDNGTTHVTNVNRVDFMIEKGNGIFSGAKLMRIFYNNKRSTRKIEIY